MKSSLSTKPAPTKAAEPLRISPIVGLRLQRQNAWTFGTTTPPEGRSALFERDEAGCG